MEWAISILVFMGVIAVTALVFAVWLVVTLLKLTFRAVGAIVAPAPQRHTDPQHVAHSPPMHGRVCANERCHATNPAGARFCRRCGRDLSVQRVSARRAAMW
jgi:ribosomal protein L40E